MTDILDIVEQLNVALAGRYVVERRIGEGGMATVYLARDLRHNRHVALKLLKPELGAMLGVERFLSEIVVTANLQHPNLLPLFDSGEAGGQLFYVMPFVDGETLRARLDREQQLPLEDSLRIAVAVLSALDYAHSHGVIHRDLKPENILLQHGQPVVADFGISLAVTNAGGSRVTQTGLSLGTPLYMSPEQATGARNIDGRSDIYSLAAVLYEMLTGEPPHPGSTSQAIIAHVLTEKPRPVRSSRDTVPAHVAAAVEKALSRLAADRFATANDFADALQRRPSVRSTMSAMLTGGGERRRERGWMSRVATLIGLVALVALGAAGMGMWSRRQMATSPAVATRFSLAIPSEAQVVFDGLGNPSAISPDGRTVAYVGRTRQGHALYVRRLDSLRATMLEGTETAAEPFFSPDGEWIGYLSDDYKLRKVRARGGEVSLVATLPRFWGGAWGGGANGVIVVGTRDGGLVTVPAAGGPATPLTQLGAADVAHVEPRFLPDGRTVLFTIRPRSGREGQLAIVSLDTKRVARIGVEGANPIGVMDGRVLYGRDDGTISAVAFDAKERHTVGPPVVVLDGVRSAGGLAAGISATGSMLYVRGSDQNRIVLVDQRGLIADSLPDVKAFSAPRLSPDGQRIAVTIQGDGVSDVWTYTFADRVLSRFTANGHATRPEWTPDGKRIAYITDPASEVWWQPADRSTPAELLFGKTETPAREIGFSPDGAFAALRLAGTGSQRDIWLMRLADTLHPLTPLVQSQFNDLMPRVSPDGRWLAYQSDETGTYEVYVRAFPGDGGRIQVSSGGGAEPVWAAPDRLLYRAFDKMMAANLVVAGTEPQVKDREVLFDDVYRRAPLSRPEYDVLPGGKLLMIRPAADANDLVVVMGWLTELRRRTAK